MSAERLDNLKVLEEIKKENYEHYKIIKNCIEILQRVDYVPNLCILNGEKMSDEEERERIICHLIARGVDEKTATKEAEEVISIFRLLGATDTQQDVLTPLLKIIHLKKGQKLEDKVKKPEN